MLRASPARALPRLWRGAWGAILLAAVVWSVKPLAAGTTGLIWAPFGLVAILALAGALGRIAITDDAQQAQRLGLGPVHSAGEPAHFEQAFRVAGVDAALAASVFHSGSIAIPDLKRSLREAGIVVRP